MSSSTNNDEVVELDEELETNYPVNTEPQKPGSSAKFYAAKGQSHLEERNDDKKAIQVQIKEITNKIESLTTFLEKQLKEKENEIKNLQKVAAGELETQIREIQNLKSENLKLTTQLVSCKDARTELNKMMTEKENPIMKLQEEAAAESDTHKKEIQNLKYENQKLKNELESCTVDARTELTKMMTEKEETIKNLQEETAAKLEILKKGMQNLKSENQKLTTELASCKKETELLQSENYDLQKQLPGKQTQYEELREKLQIAELDPIKKQIQILKNLLVSDDSHRKLSQVDLPSNLSEDSTSLRIENRMINYIAPGTIDNLSSLTYLDFSFSGLTFLEKGVFNNLTNLIYLELDNNYLTCLEENVFACLKKLKKISLYNNKITKFPPQLFRGLDSLENVYLDSNKISVFDEDLLVGLNRLTKFDADNNNLTSIPRKLFGDCVKLEYVYLSNNKIARLKKTIFDSLHNLKWLDLQLNPLNEMDKNALKMLKIENLFI